MNTDELSSRLHDFVTATAAVPDLEAIVRGGRRRQARRRAELSLTGVVAVGIVAVVLGLMRAPAARDTSPIDSPTPSASSTPSLTPAPAPRHTYSAPTVPISPLAGTGTPPASPVITVTSGQKIPLVSDLYLTLTRTRKCYGTKADLAQGMACKSLTDGNQAPGSASMQSGGGDQQGVFLVTGIYTGSNAATIVIGTSQNARVATIVKLKGMSSPVAYYVLLPAGDPVSQTGFGGGPGSLNKVYDARGKVISTLP